ncbi:FAD-dependent oxidoreductase [Streptomyces xanthii]|uniref:FAD-dependent oxidoreductase n=1 Tax=Streptomyces xanthii TaxID=2768069 RepID=A0A7H1BBF7_9ACTN|nr:FAD-dependent oxidoreductase [Streptomyces xanthii]QNS06062.1 FAD-dependent oxidoreductase [Streptomyces xanthii]
MAAGLSAQVCVVGGGPAGLTLALELARRGVEVVVVEQSAHFDRSFRGESISPDSVWLLKQLGVLDKVEDQTLVTRRMEITDAGHTVLSADFSVFDQPCPYPMELPQPPLLDALAEAGSALPSFRMLRRTKAARLLTEGNRVTGVVAQLPDGPVEIRASLTVAADGRFSKIREMAGINYTKIPLERDFVWFKAPMPKEWDLHTYRVRILGDRHGLFIPTVPDLVRIGFNIPKGGLRELRAQGIGALHARIDELAPQAGPGVREHVTSWSDTSMLDIFTTVVPQWWRPGVALIGDAAHTLTPVLGQGVNHAIIDAVTLAPLVTRALAAGGPTDTRLDRACAAFQSAREESVATARGLQLRQEKAFALSSPVAAALRRTAYRAVSSSDLLKRRILSGVYYQLQQAVRDGRTRLELADRTVSPSPAGTPTGGQHR